MTIRIKQASEYSGNDRWNWSVWIDGPARELDGVSHVVYTLHPSFAEPVRRISTRANGFRLNSSGWGRFEMRIQIMNHSGSQISRKHKLDLEYPTGESSQLTQPGIEKRGPEPTIFVSNSATDLDISNGLRLAMESLGIETLASGQHDSDSPSITTVAQLIQDSDGMVVVLTGKPTLWVHNEIEAAKHYKKPIISVLASKSALPPASARTNLTLQMFTAAQADSVAKTIAAFFQKARNVSTRTKRSPSKRSS